MSGNDLNRILREVRCKNCESYFLWHWKLGADFRCDRCRNKGCTVEEVQAELESMSQEEYDEFMQEIKEYEENSK